MDCRREEDRNNFNAHNQPFGLISLKLFILLTLFFVFFLPLISAVEVSMNSQFAKGETLLAVFSGNFVDQITNDNVVFKRGNVEIPMVSGVVKINNDFYVYALLNADQTPGNYSIRIEGVRYYQATQIIENDIVSNFTVSEDTAEFSVNPGALSVSAGFSVELQNLQDRRITVGISASSSSINSVSSVELNTGVASTVSFALDSQAPRGLATVTFTSGNATYSMPVYLDTTTPPEEDGTDGTGGGTIEEDLEMEFQPSIVSVSLATNSDVKRILHLKNTGASALEDISFNVPSLLSPYVTVSPDEINTLEPGEIMEIELTISAGNEEAILEGDITASASGISDSFTLILDFAEGYIPPEPTAGEDPTIVSLCEDFDGGVICSDNQKCSGDIVRTKNGDCCIAPLVCQEPKRSATNTIIGWGLLLIVFLIIIWFFKRKYRKVMPRRPF